MTMIGLIDILYGLKPYFLRKMEELRPEVIERNNAK